MAKKSYWDAVQGTRVLPFTKDEIAAMAAAALIDPVKADERELYRYLAAAAQGNLPNPPAWARVSIARRAPFPHTRRVVVTAPEWFFRIAADLYEKMAAAERQWREEQSRKDDACLEALIEETMAAEMLWREQQEKEDAAFWESFTK